MSNAADAQPNGTQPNGTQPNGTRGVLTKAPISDNSLNLREAYGGGPYPYAEGDFPDFAETVRDYLRIIYRRRWLILSILGIIATLGTLRVLMMTPLYTSTVRIQIEENAAKIVEGGIQSEADGRSGDFLRTQYELLQSRSLAQRVAMTADLASDQDFLHPKSFSLLGAIRAIASPVSKEDGDTSDKADLLNRAAGILTERVSVKPVAGSRLVDISYADPVPSRAQKIANAYADAYVSSNLDKRFEANAYAKTFLEDQVKQLKARMEQSEKQLIDFGEKERILELNDKSSIVENNLAAANAALGGLISERIKNENLWKQLETVKGFELPQLLSNSVIDGLRQKRNELVTEYQQKLETFKPQYPAMLQIQNRIAEIDRQLGTEVKTIRGALKAAYESSLGQENEMKARIENLKSEALDLQKRSIQYNTLKREVETNRGLYNGLLQRYKEVDVAGGVGANNVFIIDKAERPGSPSSPLIMRSILLSILLGLGAGIGAAVLLDKMDDVVVSMEEAERLSGMSVLGVIPKTKASAEVELVEPRSTLSEAYRSLCTSLQFATEHGLPRSLAITSAGPGEGKSLTSLAIGCHFARLGLKVLLIDADLRNPSLHKKLNLDNSVGLSNYLTGANTPPETLQRSELDNLAIMSSGPLPPNAADLLSGARFASLLSNSLEIFDLVLIDGPPVLGLADAVLLSNAAEATIFVVGAGKVRRGDVSGALKRLAMSKSSLIGAVLTMFDAKKAGYGYGYGYGYGGRGYGDYSYGVRHEPAPLISQQSGPS